MKISTILDHIDSGHMALPEFQRGYVWSRKQVRELFDSLYRRHPVGGLLVWATQSNEAEHRGEGQLAAGVVKLLLDGQQRITSLYGVARGRPPEFFDGNAQAFEGLYFHVDEEIFAFYQPSRMKGNPLWIDVSELMQKGTSRDFIDRLLALSEDTTRLGDFMDRLSKLNSIKDIDLHVDEVTGTDKSLDIVVDIFNRVNSGGTKLSKGDLALARRALLAEETNKRLTELLHGDTHWLERLSAPVEEPPSAVLPEVIGGISSEEEEQELEAINRWIAEQGLPQGQLAYAFADEETGEQKAVFDLVWPDGIQSGLSQPVAVLLNEGGDVIALASGAGYRCFTTPTDFRQYVEDEFLFQVQGV